MFTDGLPALRYGVLFCVGIILGFLISIPLWIITMILILVVGLIPFKQFRRSILCVCIILCGMLRATLSVEHNKMKWGIPATRGEMIVTILSQRTNPFYITSYIIESRIDDIKIKGTLYSRKDLPVLIPGHAYLFSDISMAQIRSDPNPYIFDYPAFARSRGWSHTFKKEKASTVIDLGVKRPMICFSYRVRDDISTRFLSILGIEKGSLVNGLLLGMKSEIPEGLSGMFRKLGISHLLAVSGLHVGLIILIIYQLLLAASVPRMPRVMIITLFMIFYCFLTGGSASVIRSSLMSIMLLFAPVFQRQYRALNAVAASAVIMLLAQPYDLMQVGFQFSYAAVFGILIAYPKIKAWFPKGKRSVVLNYILDMICVSFSAALFTAPVALYYFNTLQLASMFLNIVVIPLTFCVMISAILCLPGLFIHTFISDLFLHALDTGLDVFRMILRLASGSGIWTLQISPYWKPLLLSVILSVLLILCVRSIKVKMSAVLVCFMIGFGWFCLSSRPEAVQPKLDKGEVVLIRKGRHALIVNTGSVHFNYNDHERYLQPVLDHWGVKEVMILVSRWEKMNYANIGSIRRCYPDCPVYVPSVAELTEERYTRIEKDTTVLFGSMCVQIVPSENELTAFCMFADNFMAFGNDGFSLNASKIFPFRNVLKHKHFFRSE